MHNNTSKRLMKNTFFLYVRMGIIMFLSLFSSRLLLKDLGIDDFGIYNLVGSIIAMVAMVKGLFSSAIQRFLNYEMGTGNYDKLRVIFNMGVFVNAIISLIFVCLVEAVGLYFFANGINISTERLYAAQIVFHLSVISSVITIMTTSYDAVVIAHEKINFFSFITVVDAVLRFLCILCLPYLKGDLLIIYAILLLLVAFIIRIVSVVYCKKNFSETKYYRVWDKTIFKKMFSFAGWQFFGNAAYTFSMNGMNMVLNIFGGASVNAARGIAFQINSAVAQFLNNILIAVNPHLIQSYAKSESSVYRKIYFISRSLFFVSFLLVVPIFFLTDYILNLWLVNVPPFTSIFVKLILVWCVIRSLHNPIDTLFKASGKIKCYQISEGVILLLPMIVSYISLLFGAPVYIMFVYMILFEVINLFVILYIAKKMISFDLIEYVKNVMLPCCGCFVIWGGVLAIQTIFGIVQLWHLIILSLLNNILALVYIGCIITSDEKKCLLSIIRNKK